MPGNAVFLTRGRDLYYGLAESPEWVRYSTADGFAETGRISFLQYGVGSVGFAHTIVNDNTAVSVLTSQYLAVVWDPQAMEIKGTIDLSHLKQEGYDLESFTTIAHDGRVYVPGRWTNWEAPRVLQKVSMTILDPDALQVVGVAEDERCGNGGRITFDQDGYGYVMGDGRNQSMQEFSAANNEESVPNCLLRIAPGSTSFEEDFFYQIPDLTTGLDSMTELEAAVVDGGSAFTMMMYNERIPETLNRTAFEHWNAPAFKMWRIQLGDEPVAEPVSGAPFSVVGFPGSSVDGKLYSGNSVDGATSTVFEVDPVANTSRQKFTMDGYYAGLYALTD